MNQTPHITVDPSAVTRIEELRKAQGNPDLKLRITVEGGGCSGFQYHMELDSHSAPDDVLFAGSVVTDTISLMYLKNSTVFFSKGLIGSEFKIDNPNATMGCGCGVSFSVNMEE